jgi:exonuclease SbcD
MRILHTSDWHLGARLGSQSRIQDQFERLDEICRYLDEREVDLLLVAGDVFDEHRADELSKLVSRLATMLRPRVTKAGLSIVFVAGNHDREHVFPLLRGMQDLVAPNSVQRVVFAGKPDLVQIESHSGDKVQLVLLPYPRTNRYDLADERWPTLDVKNQALAAAVRRAKDELGSRAMKEAPRVPVIMSGHFFIRGVTEGLYHLSEQEDVVLEPEDMPTYSYVALGHIHKPQAIGRPDVLYCGSLERMDKGETADSKQVVLVDLGREGSTSIEPLPLSATPFAQVDASSEEELTAKAAALEEPARTLVSVTLHVNRNLPLGPLQSRALELFPRLYQPVHFDFTDAEQSGGSHSLAQSKDVAATVRDYLAQELVDDPQKDELLELAEQLLRELEGIREEALATSE